MVVTVRLATNEMDASASPLKPEGRDLALRSSNVDELGRGVPLAEDGEGPSSRMPHAVVRDLQELACRRP